MATLACKLPIEALIIRSSFNSKFYIALQVFVMTAMDRRLITHANWSLLGFTLILFFIGVANLYSASGVRMDDGIMVAPFYQKQLLWGAVGLVCMVACTLFDYRHLRALALPLCILSVVLLLLVPIAGKTVYGAKRWLDFGLFNLQPSEVAKITTLLLSASMLSRYKDTLKWRELVFLLLVLAIPCALIFLQPELGTTRLLFFLMAGMILNHGVRDYVCKTC